MSLAIRTTLQVILSIVTIVLVGALALAGVEDVIPYYLSVVGILIAVVIAMFAQAALADAE